MIPVKDKSGKIHLMPDPRKMVEVAKRAEPNVLRIFDDLYPAAVEQIAKSLRRRFQSGALRGWIEGDGNRFHGGGPGSALRTWPPSWRLERACGRWITSPLRAIVVLTLSPNSGTEAWDWRDCNGAPLSGAAEAAMAMDVLAYARAQGWTKRQRGEERAKLLRRTA